MNTPKPRWDVITIFAGTTLVTLFVAPWHAITHGFSNALWALFVLFMLWNGLSITAGYHRLWAHKSYKAHPAIRLVFALGGALAVQNSIRVWCSNHRRHHQHVDEPDRDPYAATRGLWFSHIGWMLFDRDAAKVDPANIKDLERDPIARWQSDNYWLLSFTLNVPLTLLLGYLVGDAWGGLLLLGFTRLVLCHHSTFFINSLAHYWGTRPYSENSTARDNPVIALLTYGEGYHNFHHTFQWDYRNGLRWYQFDPTKWLIRVLNLLGLTSHLKRTPPETIEQSIATMQLIKAQEAIKSIRFIDSEYWLERLEHEYNSLLRSLETWAEYRQQWMDLKRKDIARQWEATELRRKLKELELELNDQRERWHSLRMQFA